jgi:hypothetical protein
MAAPDVRRWVGERWGDPVFWSHVVQVEVAVANPLSPPPLPLSRMRARGRAVRHP